MATKIAKTKTIKSKTSTVKTPIKPRVVAKKTTLTPPSFQSTVNTIDHSTLKNIKPKKKKKYPLIGLALMAFLITIIALLVIIYQNKNEWQKFGGNMVNEKINKAIDNLVLPQIVSDKIIANGNYALLPNCWSPEGKKLFVQKNDGENITLEIFDLENNTTTPVAVDQNQADLSLVWLDENSISIGDEIISLVNGENENAPDIAEENINDFQGFSKVISDSKKNDYSVTYKISPNQEYLAYVSEKENHLWVRQKNMDDVAFDLGQINTNENNLPKIQWSKDSQYLIIDQNEVFDAINKKTILPYLENQNDQRKTLLSADQTKFLVIEKLNNQIPKIYLINIEGYKKINILNADNLDLSTKEIAASFSDNSQYLAFALEKQLWLAETKTGKAKILKTADSNYQNIYFSPNSLKIAYTLDSGELGIIEFSWLK